MNTKTASFSRCLVACISFSKRKFDLLKCFFNVLNARADESAEKLILKMDYETEDGEDSVLSTFSLVLMLVAAAASLWWICSMNISLAVQASFGATLPFFENLITMSRLELCISRCALPVAMGWSAPFLFHLVRHTWVRLKH